MKKYVKWIRPLEGLDKMFIKDIEHFNNRFEVIDDEQEGIRVKSYYNTNDDGRGSPFWFFMKGDYQEIQTIVFPEGLFEI